MSSSKVRVFPGCKSMRLPTAVLVDDIVSERFTARRRMDVAKEAHRSSSSTQLLQSQTLRLRLLRRNHDFASFEFISGVFVRRVVGVQF